MKRKFFLFVVAAIIAFYACDKKDSGGGGISFDPEAEEQEVENALGADFSENTDEENKANLAQEGEDMLTVMQEMSEEEAMEVLVSFGEKMSTSSPMSAELAEVTIDPMLNVAKADKANDVLNALKSTMEEEPSYSLMDEFNEVTYKFSWNAATMAWDYVDIDGAIIFEFPGKEGDLTNTARITINQFQVQTITNPHKIFELELEDGPLEVPIKLHADLTYTGTTLVTFDYNASFQADGIPVSATANLQIGVFGFELAVTHTPYTDASIKFTSNKGSEIIIQAYLGAAGGWSEADIEAHTVMDIDTIWEYDPILMDYVEVPDTTYELEVQDIIQEANSYLQVMGVKLAGSVNIQDLVNGINDLEDDLDEGLITEEDATEELVDLINDNATLVLVYVADNSKIAEAEMYYPKSYPDCWEEYDYATETWEEVCDGTYDAPGIYLVFSDGSKVDAETYFTENFEDLEASINEMMQDLMEQYGYEDEGY